MKAADTSVVVAALASWHEGHDRLVEAGISGGASYDALIAATASKHGATLLTRDTRAVKVYVGLGVRFELVA